MNPAFNRAAAERFKRIRAVDGFPGGMDVLRALVECSHIAAEDGDQYTQDGWDYSVNKWLSFGLPSWWVRDGTVADLTETELPDVTPANVDWPFPAFALVYRNAILLVSTGITFIDAAPGGISVSGAYNLGDRVCMTGDVVRGNESLSTVGGSIPGDIYGSAQARAAVRIAVGAALYLSTRPAEHVRAAFLSHAGGGRGSSPIERLRAKLPIDPTWLEDAVPDIRRTYGTRGGTHASPETHCRRAHWRQQRVGAGRKDSRMVWVRCTTVSRSVEHAG